jgi:hypothetical protein
LSIQLWPCSGEAVVGDDLDVLIITTARNGLTDPLREAGTPSRVVPGVKGLPVAAFAG